MYYIIRKLYKGNFNKIYIKQIITHYFYKDLYKKIVMNYPKIYKSKEILDTVISQINREIDSKDILEYVNRFQLKVVARYLDKKNSELRYIALALSTSVIFFDVCFYYFNLLLNYIFDFCPSRFEFTGISACFNYELVARWIFVHYIIFIYVIFLIRIHTRKLREEED